MTFKLATRFAQARKKESHAKTREEDLTQRRQDAKVKGFHAYLSSLAFDGS
jgi:hypothetical protein